MAENTDNPHDSSSSLKPVELIIDGRYLGIYGLQTVLDSNSQQLNNTTDYLYYPKGTGSVTKNVTSSSNESESFDEFTVGKIISAPKDNSGNTWQPFIDYINAVLWDYYYTGKYDIELAKSVCDYENIIDFYLWRELTFAGDNGRKNVYYVAYYDATAHNNLRFLRIPWVTNYTFGDCWIPGAALRAYSSEWATSNCDNYMDPICTCCYLADKDMFSSLLYERWQRLKSIIDAESLADRARTLYNDIDSSGALTRDHNLYQINQTGNLDIDELCDAIFDRFDYMDKRINNIVTDSESEYWRQLEMLMNYVV